MVYFQTKNPNLGKFWRALDRKIWIYFWAILNISRIFGIFYDHLVHFVFIWYIFPVFVSHTKKNLATLTPGDSAHWHLICNGRNHTDPINDCELYNWKTGDQVSWFPKGTALHSKNP
jgi:hypothetical protein